MTIVLERDSNAGGGHGQEAWIETSAEEMEEIGTGEQLRSQICRTCHMEGMTNGWTMVFLLSYRIRRMSWMQCRNKFGALW